MKHTLVPITLAVVTVVIGTSVCFMIGSLIDVRRSRRSRRTGRPPKEGREDGQRPQAAQGGSFFKRTVLTDVTIHIVITKGETFAPVAPLDRMRSFAIVTITPNELCAELHNRMPVVLGPETWPAWLGKEPADPPQLKALLAPYPPRR
jgi:hypothetical protein